MTEKPKHPSGTDRLGLSIELRDIFAMAAMAPYFQLAHHSVWRKEAPEIAGKCYEVADAMLKAREKRDE